MSDEAITLGSPHEEWEKFKATVYPGGMPLPKKVQLHQAYFAGALMVLAQIEQCQRLSDEQDQDPEALMAALGKEIVENVQQHKAAHKVKLESDPSPILKARFKPQRN